MKTLFAKIKVGFAKVSWVLRRLINRFKTAVRSVCSKAWVVVSNKDKRLAKERIKLDYLKDYLEFEDYNLDVRFDINLNELRTNLRTLNEESKEYEPKRKAYVDSIKGTNKHQEYLVSYEAGINRLKSIDEKRLVLAVQYEKDLRLLQEKTDKEINKISYQTSSFNEEILNIQERHRQEKEALRIAYNKASHQIFLDSEKISYPKEIEEAHHHYKVRKAYKSLPTERAVLEKREKFVKAVKSILQATLYLAPVMILLIIFSFYPIVNSFRLSIYQGYSEIDGSIAGYTLFGNFINVLKDANFIVPSSHTGSSALINTVVIVALSVPLTIIIGLAIAVGLNSIKPLKGVLQTIFFLPYVTNSLALGLVFAYIFRNDGGLFNQFLRVFGIDGGAWVGVGASYWKAMFVMIVFSVWNGLAFKIMVFLSAIQGIDKQYYQAASIDATPRFKQFRRITVPLISPTILYIVITSVIGGFKTYTSVIALFGQSGAPRGATYNLKTIVFYIYDFFEVTGKLSEAAAASIILFALILLMTLVQMQVSKKRVHY